MLNYYLYCDNISMNLYENCYTIASR